MASVLFAPEARRDLLDIKSYLDQRNPKAAKSTLAACSTLIDRLADNPKLGRLRADLRPDLRSIVGASPYVIFYRYRDDTDVIEIVRILHGQRDIGSII